MVAASAVSSCTLRGQACAYTNHRRRGLDPANPPQSAQSSLRLRIVVDAGLTALAAASTRTLSGRRNLRFGCNTLRNFSEILIETFEIRSLMRKREVQRIGNVHPVLLPR